MTTYQGRIVPTIGAILLFGVDRLSRYPDAWIQAGRFAGNDRHRIMDTTEVRSYLPGAAEEVIAFLQKHMTREAVIGSVKRTDVWNYPVVAVREAIMNAIVHADYAQRGAPIGLSTSQIAEEIGLSPRATRTRLASLVERGLIVEIGSGPKDPHRRYHLASVTP